MVERWQSVMSFAVSASTHCRRSKQCYSTASLVISGCHWDKRRSWAFVAIYSCTGVTLNRWLCRSTVSALVFLLLFQSSCITIDLYRHFLTVGVVTWDYNIIVANCILRVRRLFAVFGSPWTTNSCLKKQVACLLPKCISFVIVVILYHRSEENGINTYNSRRIEYYKTSTPRMSDVKTGWRSLC